MGIFYRLARLELEPATAWMALLLMATFPVAFILFAPYTEACSWYGQRRRFIASVAKVGPGSPVQLPGCPEPPKGISWHCPWHGEYAGLQKIPAGAGKYAGLAGSPGCAGRIGSLGLLPDRYLHEGKLDFSNIQGMIYSALLSPSANKVIAGSLSGGLGGLYDRSYQGDSYTRVECFCQFGSRDRIFDRFHRLLEVFEYR